MRTCIIAFVTAAVTLTLVSASVLPAAAQGPYVIKGGDTGVYHQHLDIWTSDFEPVADAVVTINGVEIPFVSGSRYSQDLPASLEAGDPFELVVEIGTDVVTGSDVVPPVAVVTAPADGASITQGTPLVVEWTSESDPDRFQISPYPCAGVCYQNVDGTVRSLEIDTSSFSTTEPVRIRIYAYNEGTFTGPADPSSSLNLRHLGSSPSITVIAATPTSETSWSALKARFRQ